MTKSRTHSVRGPRKILPPSGGAARRRTGGPRAELVRGLLAVAGLCSLAIAQPIYDLLRRTPEFFAIRELSTMEVAALIALLAIGPPLALSAPAAARFFRPTWIRPAIAGPIGLLSGTIALQAARGLPATIAAAIAAAGGVAAVWAYVRFPAVRFVAPLLSATVILAPAILLLDTDVRRGFFNPDSKLPLHDAGAQAPVVLVVFDEWSVISTLDGEGRIDGRRLPNLARLADGATWYPNATAASNMTSRAVPAILTGVKPEPEQLPIAEDHPVSLFTLLATSHDVFAMEPVTSLCPPRLNRFEPRRPSFARRFSLLVSDLRFVWLGLTLPARWADQLPPLDRTWSGFGLTASAVPRPPPSERQLARDQPHRRNDQRVADFRRFVESIAPPADRPGLYFSHVLLPHGPWEYLPSGRRYWRSRSYGLHDGVWTTDRATVRNHQKRYLLQVQFVDRLIGELMTALESHDLFERSLIVVTADHGISFQPGMLHRLPAPDPSGDQLLDLVSVPLIVKAPFQKRAEIDDRPFSLVDLLPRMLELAGAESDAVPRSSTSAAEPLLFGEHAAGLDVPVDRDPWRVARIAAQTELLGKANDPATIGTLPDLHGRPVAELPVRDGDVRARFDRPRAWDDVDMDAMYLPAIVEASLTPPERRIDRPVAVALNGVVADTVRAYVDARGRSRVSALLPDGLLRPGRNRVDLFLVSDPEGALELERLEPPEVFAYQADSDHSYEAVRDSAGRIRGLRRTPTGSPAGETETLRAVASSRQLLGHLDATVRLQGTADDRRGLFRIGGRVFDELNPGEPNTVVALVGTATTAFTGPPLRDNGFEVRLLADREQVEREGVVVFAVGHGGVATRLRFGYLPIERDAGSREIIPVSDGRRLVVAPPGPGYAGAVDRVAAVEKSTRIRAWAADLERMEPPRQIIVYRDNEFLALLGRARRERHDMAKRLNAPHLVRTGFHGTVPGGPLPSVFARRHRVFAVMNRGVAIELPILPVPAG